MSGNPKQIIIPVPIELPEGFGGETIDELKALVRELSELRDALKASVGKTWWTEEELANEFPNCSLITLQRARRAGKIRYKRLGNEILYSRKHIEDYINGV
jgi:hypothetical protein